MQLAKRFILSFLIFVFLCSSCVVFAEEPRGTGFADWSRGGGFSESYPNYPGQLMATDGTTKVAKSGHRRIYFHCSSVVPTRAIVLGTFNSAFTFGASFKSETSGSYQPGVTFTFDTFTLPVACNFTYNLISYNTTNTSPWSSVSAVYKGAVGDVMHVTGSRDYFYPIISNRDLTSLVYGSCFIDYVPTVASTIPVDPGTRVSSINNGIQVVNGDGVVSIVDTKIFNETTNVLSDPLSGTSYNVTDWTYDYSDRSYSVTTDSGSIGKVVYGDDVITYTITNNSGDSVTNNYYYAAAATPTDPTDPTDPTSTSIWEKLGSLVSGVFSGLIAFFTGLVSGILDALISLVDMVNSKFLIVGQSISSLFIFIPTLFGSFLAFLGSAFSFLPPEILAIIEFGLVATILVGLVLRIVKR